MLYQGVQNLNSVDKALCDLSDKSYRAALSGDADNFTEVFARCPRLHRGRIKFENVTVTEKNSF